MLLVATPAAAQRTVCSEFMGTLTCDTAQPARRPDAAAELNAALHSAAMLRLSNGDCEGAIKAAILSEDIDFATKVRDYCARDPDRSASAQRPASPAPRPPIPATSTARRCSDGQWMVDCGAHGGLLVLGPE
jgi:hypothetical protein